jgi:hypothetical protein
MGQREPRQESDTDKDHCQKPKEEKGVRLRTDTDQYQREEDNDLRPGVQMVYGTLYSTEVIEKGMFHQLKKGTGTFLSPRSNSLFC